MTDIWALVIAKQMSTLLAITSDDKDHVHGVGAFVD